METATLLRNICLYSRVPDLDLVVLTNPNQIKSNPIFLKSGPKIFFSKIDPVRFFSKGSGSGQSQIPDPKPFKLYSRSNNVKNGVFKRGLQSRILVFSEGQFRNRFFLLSAGYGSFF